jgi:RNA polymerase sigma-70 factor, ECF subfamily
VASFNLAERVDEGSEPGPSPDLEQAFFEHAERMERFFMRLGHRRVDAEDLTSQVFLIAQERLGAFDRSKAILPWLFGIAVNVSKKHRRRQWVKSWIAAALARETGEGKAPDDAERALLDREDRERVQRTLESMAERKRVLLVLRECEELSAREIGAVLGMAESNIYAALHHARKEFMRLYRRRIFLEGRR